MRRSHPGLHRPGADRASSRCRTIRRSRPESGSRPPEFRSCFPSCAAEGSVHKPTYVVALYILYPTNGGTDMDSIKMEITGYQVLEKRVMKHGNGAHLLVPVAWVGRRCK